MHYLLLIDETGTFHPNEMDSSFVMGALLEDCDESRVNSEIAAAVDGYNREHPQRCISFPEGLHARCLRNTSRAGFIDYYRNYLAEKFHIQYLRSAGKFLDIAFNHENYSKALKTVLFGFFAENKFSPEDQVNVYIGIRHQYDHPGGSGAGNEQAWDCILRNKDRLESKLKFLSGCKVSLTWGSFRKGDGGLAFLSIPDFAGADQKYEFEYQVSHYEFYDRYSESKPDAVLEALLQSSKDGVDDKVTLDWLKRLPLSESDRFQVSEGIWNKAQLLLSLRTGSSLHFFQNLSLITSSPFWEEAGYSAASRLRLLLLSKWIKFHISKDQTDSESFSIFVADPTNGVAFNSLLERMELHTHHKLLSAQKFWLPMLDLETAQNSISHEKELFDLMRTRSGDAFEREGFVDLLYAKLMGTLGQICAIKAGTPGFSVDEVAEHCRLAELYFKQNAEYVGGVPRYRALLENYLCLLYCEWAEVDRSKIPEAKKYCPASGAFQGSGRLTTSNIYKVLNEILLIRLDDQVDNSWLASKLFSIWIGSVDQHSQMKSTVPRAYSRFLKWLVFLCYSSGWRVDGYEPAISALKINSESHRELPVDELMRCVELILLKIVTGDQQYFESAKVALHNLKSSQQSRSAYDFIKKASWIGYLEEKNPLRLEECIKGLPYYFG